MAVKNCCIKSCQSCSTRAEDVGVTYHKYPKDEKLLAVWINVTQHKSSESPSYVCSRHFRKTDFQLFKDSKYILKSGAVPSIFPWSIATNMETSKESNKMDVDNTSVEIFNENTDVEAKTTEHNSSNKSENLETIKSFIEQETGNEGIVEISENPKDVLSCSEEKNEEKDNVDKSAERMDEGKDNCSNETKETREETVAVATSVMDMILSESESKIAKKTDCKITACKPSIPAAVKGHNSVSLSVGSKVEAKDFAEYWHPAEIMEVDYEEMEVLVHYENALKKHDEWISVSSPRLRPLGSGSATSAKPSTPAPQEDEMTSSAQVKEEPKTEEKTRPVFAVGERCLARWRDNRRFIATVTADLGDGKYDIVFDDGARWSCTTTRLYKLKEPNKNDPLTVDTGSPSVASTPSPDLVPKPVTGQLIYNTHLFDPTRDYLGSKSERREMKRKINIKEIFNIGQKKKKIKEEVPEMKSQKQVKVKKETPRRPPILRRKVEASVKAEVKKEVPDAVASIIGTLSNEEIPKDQYSTEVKKEVKEESKCEISQSFELSTIKSETLSAPETQDIKMEVDPKVLEEETKLEKFEMPSDDAHVEVIDRIKEVINKLEDGINKADDKINSIEPPKPTIKEEETMEHDTDTHPKTEPIAEPSDVKHESKQSKVKKGKKLRLLQEKQVKQQVEKVKSELEEMKRQMEEIKKQMLEKTEEMSMSKSGSGMEMPESFLLPGEWCCKWVNGQPVGKVSEIENEVKVDANNKPVLPRRSVQVEDKRLPPGWTKHMVRRSFGHSAGKWDVVLISPGNRRFHTKTDMRNYLENNPREVEALQPYVDALLDFGVHLKLSRRMGWYTVTPDGVQESPMPLPAGILSCTSPLVKRKSLSLKKRSIEKKDKKKKKRKLKIQLSRSYPMGGVPGDARPPEEEPMEPQPPLEDGYVYVGSLKVQVNGTLLRCPAEGCLKNFRNNTLLKMHITHYHRELRKMLGATPKVLDLAFARTRPNAMDAMKLKLEAETKTLKVKLPRLPKRLTEPKQETVKAQQISTPQCEVKLETVTPLKQENDKPLKQLDSPKLRTALTNKPVKRPKVLLPVRRLEPIETEEVNSENSNEFLEPKVEVPIEPLEPLDFETAISTHTVTKPSDLLKRKGDRKRKTFASISSKKNFSEDEEWFATNNSDMETRSSYGPRSGTPDSKTMDLKTSSELNDEDKVPNYMYTETGERIKIVHMKREEIINCHCGFREEDGLMVQCELCLCWQHALCHNIHKEADVPEKYTCSICLNPRRGRRSQRFLHDQDRLYEGLLPGAKPCESLRRSHELSGNLIRIEDALHALRVKYYVATKKDHPKLYLWAKDWETSDSSLTQDRLNSDYSDLSIMISGVGKENLPVRDDARDINVDMRTPPSSEAQEGERYSQRDNQLGSQSLLSGLLSSPGGASLDLPLSTSEFEKIAKSVQEQEVQRVIAPQPEAAIENSACRERLLRHIQRCQALIDARLDSIEAQVAELESQDPSFEDDETADYFPRTKQTIQMLMRDLETMEELGVIT